MSYDILIEKNAEYKKLYDDYNKILNEKRNDLTTLNNDLVESLDIEKLDYVQLENLISLIGYNIDNNLKKKLDNAYLYKRPYIHKIVEKMDFLDKDSKIKLDFNLSYFKNRYIIHKFWSDIRVNKEIQEKIVQLLLEERYLLQHYYIHCSKCHDRMTIFRQEELKTLTELINLKKEISNYEDKHRNDGLTDTEKSYLDTLYDNYYNIVENDNPLYHYCESCNYENEFENQDELFKYSSKIYYLIDIEKEEKINV